MALPIGRFGQPGLWKLNPEDALSYIEAVSQTSNRVYVDGSREDSYTPNGSIGWPYKTIQAAVNASEVGDCISISASVYNENVTMPADRNIDADPGSFLAPTSGTALTLTELTSPPEFGLGFCFIRGLNIHCQDAGYWILKIDAVHPERTGMIIVLDQILGASNRANGIWVRQGGVYLSDGGAIMGDDTSPAITLKVGDTGLAGCQATVGAYNMGVGEDGLLVDMYANCNVQMVGANLGISGAGSASIVSIHGGGPDTYTNFMAKDCSTYSGWKSYVRATGDNVRVRIEGDYGEGWTAFTDPVIAMSKGQLFLRDVEFGSNNCVLALGAPTENMHFDIKDAKLTTRGNSRPVEIYGNANGTFYNSQLVAFGDPSLGECFGAILMSGTGAVNFIDGSMESNTPNTYPTCDVRSGHLWLLGGVDIITNGNAPSISVAAGGNIYRGHCNIRGGAAPVMLGAETILGSNFGDLYLGSLRAPIRISTWYGSSLPPNKFPPGSLCIWPTAPGGPAIFINRGTESSPIWSSPQTYIPLTPSDWAGTAPTSVPEALNRIAIALREHLIPA